MNVNKLQTSANHWRPYRFPPRPIFQPNPLGMDSEKLQRAVNEGFQEGSEKGYEQGLAQGQADGQREGFAKGHSDGFISGREEGKAEGRRQFEQAGMPLEQASLALQQFMQEMDIKRRQELLELVKKVAQQVIRVELTLHPTQLLNLAEEALAALPEEQGDVNILLNPEECARIRDLAPARAQSWRLQPDERLALGECRVVTGQRELDVGCQQRLDSCIQALSDHMQVSEA